MSKIEDVYVAPIGWALKVCSECKIQLVVKKTSRDNTRCGVCGFVFKPKNKSEIVKQFAKKNKLPIKDIKLKKDTKPNDWVGLVKSKKKARKKNV